MGWTRRCIAHRVGDPQGSRRQLPSGVRDVTRPVSHSSACRWPFYRSDSVAFERARRTNKTTSISRIGRSQLDSPMRSADWIRRLDPPIGSNEGLIWPWPKTRVGELVVNAARTGRAGYLFGILTFDNHDSRIHYCSIIIK